jgi:hypothetical protein
VETPKPRREAGAREVAGSARATCRGRLARTRDGDRDRFGLALRPRLGARLLHEERGGHLNDRSETRRLEINATHEVASRGDVCVVSARRRRPGRVRGLAARRCGRAEVVSRLAVSRLASPSPRGALCANTGVRASSRLDSGKSGISPRPRNRVSSVVPDARGHEESKTPELEDWRHPSSDDREKAEIPRLAIWAFGEVGTNVGLNPSNLLVIVPG